MSYVSEFQGESTLPLLFKRAEHKKIARWAILAKEPDCREGAGGRVKEALGSCV